MKYFFLALLLSLHIRVSFPIIIIRIMIIFHLLLTQHVVRMDRK
jgi:hypothetical protein